MIGGCATVPSGPCSRGLLPTDRGPTAVMSRRSPTGIDWQPCSPAGSWTSTVAAGCPACSVNATPKASVQATGYEIVTVRPSAPTVAESHGTLSITNSALPPDPVDVADLPQPTATNAIEVTTATRVGKDLTNTS